MEIALIIIPIVLIGGMLLAFRAGYNAGRLQDRLIAPEPNIELPDEEEIEKAPSHEEIMEDIERSRTIMQGYDFNN